MSEESKPSSPRRDPFEAYPDLQEAIGMGVCASALFRMMEERGLSVMVVSDASKIPFPHSS